MSRSVRASLSLALVAAAAPLSRAWPEPAGEPAPAAARRAIGALQPRQAPAGDRVAFSYLGAIRVLPAGGGTMTRLTPGDGLDRRPRPPVGRTGGCSPAARPAEPGLTASTAVLDVGSAGGGRPVAAPPCPGDPNRGFVQSLLLVTSRMRSTTGSTRDCRRAGGIRSLRAATGGGCAKPLAGSGLDRHHTPWLPRVHENGRRVPGCLRFYCIRPAPTEPIPATADLVPAGRRREPHPTQCGRVPRPFPNTVF
jgi:hypothetical protein